MPMNLPAFAFSVPLEIQRSRFLRMSKIPATKSRA